MKTKKQLQARIERLQGIINDISPDGTIRYVNSSTGETEWDFSHAYGQKEEAPNVGVVNEEAAESQKEDPELPLNKRAEILRTAEELINGDRAQTYGPPEVSFGRIADIFNAMGYRHHVQPEDSPLGYTKANKLDAVDAALILIGMKLSRTIGGRHHMDNWIDLAGYSGLGAELASGEVSNG